MAKPLKLAIIGAGSATFSLGLLRDLCLQRSLWGSLVAFMDLDAERLEVIHTLAARYAGELGVDLRFETTLDRRRALADADFVINTAALPHGKEEKLRAIGEKHGYYRGAHFGYYQHQLDLMMGVARDIEAVCPDAWLIQSSNPVFEGCTLMTRETGVKVVGLCHGHYGYREVAEIIGLDPDSRASADARRQPLHLADPLRLRRPRRLPARRRVDRDEGRGVLGDAQARVQRQPDVARGDRPVPDRRPDADWRHAEDVRLAVPPRPRDEETVVRLARRLRLGDRLAALPRRPRRESRADTSRSPSTRASR